jgi:hypothetical protein
VGDIEVLYRVNEDGTLNLRLLIKENDINYIGQGIGYTRFRSFLRGRYFFKEFVNKNL